MTACDCPLRLTTAILALLLAASSCAGKTIPWQLVFSYEEDDLSLVRADPLPATKKSVYRDETESSPLVIHYGLTWLDSEGASLHATPVSISLGSWYDDFGAGAGGVTIPEKGGCVITVTGPPAETDPQAVHLRRTGTDWRNSSLKSEGPPVAFRFDEVTLSLEKKPAKTEAEQGPVGIEKIHDSGDDGNRIVVAILGDGYLQEDLDSGLFASDADRVLQAMRTAAPWDGYMECVNVYRIDVVSNERGADRPEEGVYVDTHLGAVFTPNLEVDHRSVHEAIFHFLPPPAPDSVLVSVNTPYRGGAASRDIGTSNNGHNLPTTALHEQGHEFGFLIDEYESGLDAPPEHQSDRLNWDRTYERDRLKWKHWVEPDTPLPTPETAEYDGVVGAFEGANRWPTGVYRPWLSCRMRSSGRPFCPVCQELLSIKIVVPLDLADSATPEAGSVVVLDSSPVFFTIDPLPISPLAFEWKFAGEVLPDATGPSLAISVEDLGLEDRAELDLTISHPTPLIRKREVFRKYFWTLKQEFSTSVSGWRYYD